MTVGALKGIEGITSREAERSKNFFALGLMSWLYHRPVEGTIAFIETKFAKRPEIVEANTKAFRAGWNYGETSEDFAVSYEVAPAPLAPGTYRQITGNTALSYGLIAASQALRPAALPRRLSDHARLVDPGRARRQEGVRRRHVPGRGRDRRRRRRARRGVRRRARRHRLRRARASCSRRRRSASRSRSSCPLLILDIQRAGPSTGMPTKPEQADLLMVLFGRNGESPVPVVAASSPVAVLRRGDRGGPHRASSTGRPSTSSPTRTSRTAPSPG